jgi:hypothetical protein
VNQKSYHPKFVMVWTLNYRLCGLVARVPGCRSRGPRSIPGASTFSEKQWLWNGVYSVSWVQLRSYLKKKSSGSSLKNRDYGHRGSATRWLCGTPLSAKVGTNFAGGPTVVIVLSQTEATFFLALNRIKYCKFMISVRHSDVSLLWINFVAL